MAHVKEMNEWADGWVGGWMDEWVHGWMGGWMDGWVGGWTDGWVHGWVGGWMGAPTCEVMSDGINNGVDDKEMMMVTITYDTGHGDCDGRVEAALRYKV